MAHKIISSKKKKTLMRMLRSAILGILGIIVILIVLQFCGINVTSMLAGVGIASIVIGFALQDSLKDIIRGFVIISDDYYEIGDVIKFGDNVGPVVSVTLLTTKIQDINTNNTVSIANRNIDKVEVDPGYVYISVPLPLNLKIAKIEEIMREVAHQLQKHSGIDSAAYQGINQVNTSVLTHQFVITCDPANKLQIRRDALRIILTALETHKIPLPHDQLDIHAKK